VEIPNPFTGKVAPWSLEMIWSIEPGSPDEPGRVWCGTIPGGLFRSDDSGDSWSLVRPLWDLEARKHWMGAGMDYAGIHSILIDPRDADHVTVGGSVGGIYHTTDGGESWAAIGEGLRAEYVPPEQAGNPEVQDPHCLVHCLGEPDTMWTQHHNGVFVSRDGGRHWDEIEKIDPFTFGFAVSVHPKAGNTAWLVPGVKDEHRVPVDGKLVVTRTRDGGLPRTSSRPGCLRRMPTIWS